MTTRDHQFHAVAVFAFLFALLCIHCNRASATSRNDAAIIDTLELGSVTSEHDHALNPDHSRIIHGGLDQSARQLLPLPPVSFDGGSISFTMKVDPTRQNYLSVKLWGSDNGAGSGRLLLFPNGLQVGYRHEGDYDVLNQSDAEGECPGRFLYQTVLLPLDLTRGKTGLNLKIAALGEMWPYGTTFEQYQKTLQVPSRGIYRVYTHTSPYFVPDPSEKQGATQSAGIRSAPGEEVIAHTRQIVNARLAKLLDSPVGNSTRTAIAARWSRMQLLAEAYNTSWTVAYHDPRAVDRILSDGDAAVRDIATNPKLISAAWTGAGPLGEAAVDVWPALAPRMAEKIAVGSSEIARGQAWAVVLRQSVDYWRMHRRAYTNQSMIVDFAIYSANRALELIEPSKAFSEAKTRAYLYEAVGLEPWLGSDAQTEGSDGSAIDMKSENAPEPYGEHYFLVTRKGLSRELGWVATYGETIQHFMCDMVSFTGDERIREQLRKMEDARLYFRYPALDADGYKCMKLASEIDNRTAHYPLSGSAYAAPNIREEWWMDIPALLTNDPVAVGAAQQSLADNQYFAYLAGRLNDPDTRGMMRDVDEYAKVKSLPSSGYRMPMSEGQPDFVFSDEEDAVLAMKHGDTRLFVNLYYRAERGVNSVARILDLTPTMTRIATVRTQCEVGSSGHTYKRPDWIDGIRAPGLPPPGENIHQAWAGEELPIAARPADAKRPEYGDWGPFLGKASLYQVRYGDYFIAVNTTYDMTYAVAVPSDAPVDALELVTGKRVTAGEQMTLRPLTTTVVYLGR